MNKRIFSLSLLLGYILYTVCTGDVFAAGETGSGYLAGYEEADPRPSAVSWWSTVAYMVSLFAVFAFVVILAYPMGPNRSVCVVELYRRVFVLGVTDANIRLIAEIDDPETVAEIRASAPAEGGVFQDQFGSLSDFVQKIPPLFRK